ncbi:MAG: AEC family transporter [Kiloniellales bacterium]|nr:AEC family transporter [Kiloniellales bacterium]
MQILLDVVVDITLPVVLIAAFGFVMQRRVGFDIATLNRLLIYVTLPCFLVHSLATAELPLSQVRTTAIFTVVQFFVLLGVGWLVARGAGLAAGARPVVALSAAFANSGNFGIPVIELAFGPAYVLHQAVITAILGILILVVLPVMLAEGRLSLLSALKELFATPLIPAVALGLLLNAFDLALPRVVAQPLQVVGSAYVAVALFGLGAQLAASGWAISGRAVAWGVVLRLCVAPLLTTLAVLLLPGLPVELRDLLIVGSCVPVGVLLAIFCAQYGRGAELASATVVVSTVLSPVVITLAVVMTRAY